MNIVIERQYGDLDLREWAFHVYSDYTSKNKINVSITRYGEFERETKRHKFKLVRSWGNMGRNVLPRPTSIPQDVLDDVRRQINEAITFDV